MLRKILRVTTRAWWNEALRDGVVKPISTHPNPEFDFHNRTKAGATTI